MSRRSSSKTGPKWSRTRVLLALPTPTSSLPLSYSLSSLLPLPPLPRRPPALLSYPRPCERWRVARRDLCLSARAGSMPAATTTRTKAEAVAPDCS
eukprot:1822214-Pleurochrysis_carterae.AAC.1